MKTVEKEKTLRLTNNFYLLLITEDGNILDSNEYFNQDFFHSQNTKKNSNIYNFLHPTSNTTFKTSLQTVLHKNCPYTTSLLLKNEILHKQIWEFRKITVSSVDYFLCFGTDAREDTLSIDQLNKQKAAFNKIKTGIFIHEKQYEISDVNDDATQLLSHSVDEIKGNFYYKNLWADKNNNGTQSTENISKTKTLSWLNGINDNRIFNFHCLSIPNSNSEIEYPCVTFFYEIKKSHSMKRVVSNQQFESLFSDFFSKSGSMKWIVDEHENLFFANDSFLNFFKLPKTAIDKNLFDIFPDSIAKLFHSGHKYVLENDNIQNYIQHSRQANGKEFFLLTNIYALASSGVTRLIAGEAIDITDSTKTKKELDNAVDRLNMMTKSTSDSIWEWNIKTGEIFRNESLHKLIGYLSMETTDLSWWYDQIHPDDKEKVEQKISYTLSHHEQVWEQEYRFKCRDGSFMQVFDRGYVMYEYGIPVKMIGTIQDLSKIKALEEYLYSEKIQNKKDIAQTIISVQEKERTNLGHELHDNVNQILMAAKLYLGMVQIDDAEKNEMKDKAVEYIMNAIEEIRILSKKLVIPQLKDGNLKTSINTLIKDIELTTGLKIDFIYEEKVEEMLQNKKLTFFRIAQEQIKNIIKHSQASHVEIKILASNKYYFLLLIKDNGVGFDTGLVREGIGLSNIFERAKLYDGSVTINSSPGNGCELVVELPKRQDRIDSENI